MHTWCTLWGKSLKDFPERREWSRNGWDVLTWTTHLRYTQHVLQHQHRQIAAWWFFSTVFAVSKVLSSHATIHLKKALTFLCLISLCLCSSQLYINTGLQLTLHHFLFLCAVPTYAVNIHPYLPFFLRVLLMRMGLHLTKRMDLG